MFIGVGIFACNLDAYAAELSSECAVQESKVQDVREDKLLYSDNDIAIFLESSNLIRTRFFLKCVDDSNLHMFQIT